MVDPHLVQLGVVLALSEPLHLPQLLQVDVVVGAELLVGVGEGHAELEVLAAQLLLEDVAAGPHDLVVVVDEDEGEGLLLLEGAVQLALDVVDFGFETGHRLHDDVGVALDQLLHVVVVAPALALDQPDLLQQRAAPVLDRELRQHVEDPHRLLRGHPVLSQRVEHALEVGVGRAQQSARVDRVVQDLLVCQLVLLEEAAELLDLQGLHRQHVGEGTHDLHHVLPLHARVQVEQEEELLQLRLQVE
mmetsp:Transcript_17588/g.29691  ORF Transcript_17588/g.29691 Transcript_17588/m.29691 type:complete len:246 (-) Transcript_17588:765-1502(-)